VRVVVGVVVAAVAAVAAAAKASPLGINPKTSEVDMLWRFGKIAGAV